MCKNLSTINLYFRTSFVSSSSGLWGTSLCLSQWLPYFYQIS